MSYVTGPKPAAEPRGTAPAGTLLPTYTTGGRPRNGSYVSGGQSEDFKKGLYVFVKEGKTVYFFSDPQGTTHVKLSGDGKSVFKESGELVGTTTGVKSISSSGKLLIEVYAVFAVDDTSLIGKLLKRKRDVGITAFVIAEDTDAFTEDVVFDSPIIDTNRPIQNPLEKDTATPPPAGDGDSDTLLYAGAGLAVVMLLNPKKRR